MHKAVEEALRRKEAMIYNKPWWAKDIEDIFKLKKKKRIKQLGTQNQNNKEKHDIIRKES